VLRVLCLVVLLLVPERSAPASPTGAEASCPVSLFQFDGRQDSVTTSSATRSYYFGIASYNCCAGVLAARAGEPGDYSSYADVALRMSDRMQVTGLPAGTLVTFTASLHVTGYAGGGHSQVLAWIADGTANFKRYSQEVFSAFHDRVIDTTLTVTLRHEAGESFDVAALLWTWEDSGWAAMNGVLTFSGLPGGARITSCRGYGTTVDVPGPGPSSGARLALSAPWPNPAHGTARLTCSIAPAAAATLTLLDVAGRRIASQALDPGPPTRTVSLALPPRAGLYFARLEQGGRTLTRALVVR
jgi:hypothetical protein